MIRRVKCPKDALLLDQEFGDRSKVRRQVVRVEFRIDQRRDTAGDQSGPRYGAGESNVERRRGPLLVRINKFVLAHDFEQSVLRGAMKFSTVLVASDG